MGKENKVDTNAGHRPVSTTGDIGVSIRELFKPIFYRGVGRYGVLDTQFRFRRVRKYDFRGQSSYSGSQGWMRVVRTRGSGMEPKGWRDLLCYSTVQNHPNIRWVSAVPVGVRPHRFHLSK